MPYLCGMKTEKSKAANNRTLTVSDEERDSLLAMLTPANHVSEELFLTDKLINGDLLQVIDHIPDGIADLIIIDPPYNLSKDFGQVKFGARSDSK